MNAEQAHTAITVAALVTVGAWGYRKLLEPTVEAAHSPAKSLLKSFVGAEHAPANTAQFAVGFGFTFISLSILATFAPSVAGGLAVTEAIGVVLVNGARVFSDVNEQVAKTTATEQATKKKK